MQFLELKIIPVVQVFICGVLMYAAYLLLPALRFDLPGTTSLAVGTTVLGFAVTLAGAWEFRKAQTTLDPRNPENASSLVQGGVYSLSRNPMYLGFLLLLLAWAIYLSHVLTFLLPMLFVVSMNRLQILPEERHMTEKYGEAYRSYMGRVRRWM